MSHTLYRRSGFMAFVFGLLAMTLAMTFFNNQIHAMQTDWSPIAGMWLVSWPLFALTIIGFVVWLSNQEQR